MSEAQQILALSQRAVARGERLCLATVVHVEGSSYRKPGARMLLTSGGERAGTISGGCLEAEVTRKAWWLTAHGSCVERYSSFAEEDGSLPYGLGCGGTVSLLLEQGEGAKRVLEALQRGLTDRQPSVLISELASKDGRPPGVLAIFSLASEGRSPSLETHYLRDRLPQALSLERIHAAASDAYVRQQSCYRGHSFDPIPAPPLTHQGEDATVSGYPEAELPYYWIEYLAPPPALTIFGAGDDAQPIATLAHSLGWRITVADGRAHLATRSRFPLAASVRVLNWDQAAGSDGEGTPGITNADLGSVCGLASTPGRVLPREPASDASSGVAGSQVAPVLQEPLASDELAIILTHSYEQDRALLAALLPRKLQYLGILGPRHRTERLLSEVAPMLGLSLEQAFARLHSPVGLDLGAGDPAAVALSILAEIQAVLHGRRVSVTRETRLAPEAEAGLKLFLNDAAAEATESALAAALRA